MIFTIASRSVVMTAGGTPAGIITPVQVISSKSGMPCSIRVGMSGVSL